MAKRAKMIILPQVMAITKLLILERTTISWIVIIIQGAY